MLFSGYIHPASESLIVANRYLEKAATVPQIAMTDPTKIIATSKIPHLPSNFTFAATGPTTEMLNAEKDPRNAIITLNSGI
jgi:hypothetical protein